MLTDEKRHELERLIAMGRTPCENPSDRLMITARAIDPSPWTDHAHEQIEWCRKHGLLNSVSHFGGQFVLLRRLALIQAEILLRDLDRNAAGLPVLLPFDARALSKKLEKQWWAMCRADTRRHLSKKAVDAVFLMRRVDGLPSPEAMLSEDGDVTLRWIEGGRSATIAINSDGKMSMTLDPLGYGPRELDFQGWRTEAPGEITKAVDWVHFGGPAPEMPSVDSAAA